MSSDTSNSRFSGDLDNMYEPNFTAEITKKMTVPKRINVDGVSNLPNVGRPESHWMPAEKLDMFVPDKIVVAGGEDYEAMWSLPREISFDNSIMPPDPGIVKVQTPPRTLTIDQTFGQDGYRSPPMATPKEMAISRFGDMDRMNVSSMSNLNESTMVEGMTLSEEVVHLRKQLAKLNRRVMSIELDNSQRQNKEKLVYALGLAYFFFKTVLWLSRP